MAREMLYHGKYIITFQSFNKLNDLARNILRILTKRTAAYYRICRIGIDISIRGEIDIDSKLRSLEAFLTTKLINKFIISYTTKN